MDAKPLGKVIRIFHIRVGGRESLAVCGATRGFFVVDGNAGGPDDVFCMRCCDEVARSMAIDDARRQQRKREAETKRPALLSELRIVHVLYHSDDRAALCGIASSRTARILRSGEEMRCDERVCRRCEILLRKIVAGTYVRST